MTLLSAGVPSAALLPSAGCTCVLVSPALLLFVFRIHLAVHPAVFDSGRPTTAIAELLQGPDVVVAEHELIDGGEGQGVGSVGPEVAERAET